MTTTHPSPPPTPWPPTPSPSSNTGSPTKSSPTPTSPSSPATPPPPTHPQPPPRHHLGPHPHRTNRTPRPHHPPRPQPHHPLTTTLLNTTHHTHQPQLAHHNNTLHTPQLTPTTQPTTQPTTPPTPFDPNTTILITGGTGTLGRIIARHLITHHGVRHLLLTSRHGKTAPGAAELATELTHAGADVHIAACDTTNRTDLNNLLNTIPTNHPLTAVIHTAGTLHDATLTTLTPDTLTDVLRPKADAAWNLHELTRHLPLTHFILYSSAAGLTGNAGQANYAAANTFLDALAHHRHTHNQPATSLAWGLWNTTSGMGGSLADEDVARWARHGLPAIGVDEGLALFDAALATGRPLAVTARVDKAALRVRAAADDLPVIFRSLVRTRVRRVARRATHIAGAQTWAERIAELPESRRREAVEKTVRMTVAAVLGHADGTKVPVDRSFKDQGFSSLNGVELRNQLSKSTELRLPTTLVFDHPSPDAVISFLLDKASPRREAAPVVPATAFAAARAGDAELDDPIAIVGMSCNLPGGVTSPEDLWRLVSDGTDAITEFPVNRGWDLDNLYDPNPDTPGRSYTRKGGFLHEADEFDAAFFGISPREAMAIEPQQRVLLETAWAALERARIRPESLKGTDTGVFIGAIAQEYGPSAVNTPLEAEGYRITGTTMSVASGRLAYTFGLEGPAVTIDTACSSSLVALHLATQSLRNGECSLALTGGATIMASPGHFIDFSRQRGLAFDGRVKAFADGADGTVWGEGVGVLVLERLSDARRNGHPVLAVVRGTAVNQDGASNGLTAPNGPSQERMIRQALTSARLAPADIDAVDAHGTGTKLGDPIEAQALLATYGQERDPERPLWLGSLKSNIGHTQAAAGVASVIKMVQAMRHGVLPRTLHVDEPTPHVDWESGAVSLLTEATPWPELDRPRRAGVSSFGISGTNAHAILEQAPESSELANTEVADQEGEGQSPGAGVPVVWPVSAKSPRALRERAVQLAVFVRESAGEVDLPDVARALATSRTHFEERAALTATTRQDLLAGLDALATGAEHPTLATGSVLPGKTVFVFPGQGSQWAGMGRDLYTTSPVFAAQLDACATALAPHTDFDLIDVIHQHDGAPGLDRVDVIQPALWAMMISLARLWQHHGIHPDAVIGHSQGEIAAAHIAGALTLEDSAAIVALRARTLRRLAGTGTMASLPLDADQARDLITTHHLDDVHIAAHNSPTTTVIAGNHHQIHTLVTACRAQDIRARAIDVDYASHTHHVETLREELTQRLAHITPQPADPTIAFYSTLHATHITDTTTLTTDYWINNLRHPVLFQQTTETLHNDGHTHYIETSPHPVLTIGLHNTLEPHNTPYTVTPTLRRDTTDTHTFTQALATTHTHGLTPHWDTPQTHIDLPTYPFQHERYWLNPGVTGGVSDVSSLGQSPSGHPLLGAAVSLAEEASTLFTGRLSLADQPWLADHGVTGTVLLPGTAFVELALHAGHHLGCERLDDLTIENPLTLGGDEAVRLQLTVGEPDEAGQRPLKVYSQTQADDDAEPGPWTRHATGVLTRAVAVPPERQSVWPPADAEQLEVADFYDRLIALGYEYGPLFQGLEAAWRVGDDICAEVALPQDTDVTGYGIHPALLDAALHTLQILEGGTEVRLPFTWSGIQLYAEGTTSLRVRVTPKGEHAVRAVFTDADGMPVAEIEELTLRPVSREQLTQLRSHRRKDLFTVEWVPLPEPTVVGTDPVWAFISPTPQPAGTLPADIPVHADLDALRAALADGAPAPDHVALILPTTDDGDDDSPIPATHTLTTHTLTFLQHWLTNEEFTHTHLTLITRDATTTHTPPTSPTPPSGASPAPHKPNTPTASPSSTSTPPPLSPPPSSTPPTTPTNPNSPTTTTPSTPPNSPPPPLPPPNPPPLPPPSTPTPPSSSPAAPAPSAASSPATSSPTTAYATSSSPAATVKQPPAQRN
ncbi:type I polyketide synthase [Streptomyces kanamyceticus]|uniref:type I polyketide synthase n=1 Tax=Streptomyces kanamyceticus TaxID=1967 RepID=UPI00123DD4E0|nr:type I polyketide synthase [Streptomyces kanamyceticus]